MIDDGLPSWRTSKGVGGFLLKYPPQGYLEIFGDLPEGMLVFAYESVEICQDSQHHFMTVSGF